MTPALLMRISILVTYFFSLSTQAEMLARLARSIFSTLTSPLVSCLINTVNGQAFIFLYCHSPDVCSCRLRPGHVPAEHDHLGAPPAHVSGGDLANASVGSCDHHSLPIQPPGAPAPVKAYLCIPCTFI